MEFQIKGHSYRAEKLSVFDQLKVSRKLLPVLASVLSDLGSIRALLPAEMFLAGTDNPEQEGGAQPRINLDAISPALEKMLPRIADVLSGLSEEDTNAIIHPCLAVVSRQHMKGWTPVFTSGLLMFDDVDLFTMLGLVARVVADSLGNFLPALPTIPTADLPAA
ncbi:TPA: hypothetical protein QCI16_004460 [Enterobacter ludwigii]|nr:hypothetical protein [Enterobacter ludwigii]HDR2600238.1 hypothetical protein [Enterobacter ludwigii]